MSVMRASSTSFPEGAPRDLSEGCHGAAGRSPRQALALVRSEESVWGRGGGVGGVGVLMRGRGDKGVCRRDLKPEIDFELHNLVSGTRLRKSFLALMLAWGFSLSSRSTEEATKN